MAFVGVVLIAAIQVYMWVLVLRAILSFVPLLNPRWQPRGLLLVIAEAIYTLTDPPLKAVGRVVKPVRIGNVGLDLAFILVWIGLIILQRVVEVAFL